MNFKQFISVYLHTTKKRFHAFLTLFIGFCLKTFKETGNESERWSHKRVMDTDAFNGFIVLVIYFIDWQAFGQPFLYCTGLDHNGNVVAKVISVLRLRKHVNAKCLPNRTLTSSDKNNILFIGAKLKRRCGRCCL